MTNETNLREPLAQHAHKLRAKLQKYAGKLVYVPRADGFAIQRWDGQAWQARNIDEPLDIGPFGQAVWLVASSRCLFQLRSFPADIVAKNDLREAVELDIEQWSPWGRDSGYYYQVQKSDDIWHLSVWVWDKMHELQQLALLQAEGWPLSHVMPEDVWSSGELHGQAYPALVICAHTQRYTYQYLDESGTTVALAGVTQPQQAQHFWRSLGAKAARVSQVLIRAQQDPAQIPWLPPIPFVAMPLSLPPAEQIERGLLPGVRNWRHPLAWKPVFYGLAALLLVWMLGSFLVVWGKEKQIAAGLAQAGQGAEEVLEARELVDGLNQKMTVINRLQEQQITLLSLLQQLSLVLPDDVWLQTMTFRQDTLEIRGQGKNAALLAGQLEKIPLIRRVSYIGDIRPDAATGQDLFALRLHIDRGTEQQP